MSLLQRVLNPVVDVRKDETVTALLMFAYAFLAMTSYNIIQPLTRSKLIRQSGCGERAMGRPGSRASYRCSDARIHASRQHPAERWALPITQAGMAVSHVRVLGALPGWRRLGLGRVLHLGSTCSGFCSSASSGRWPTASTIRARRSGSSASLAAASCSAA